MRSGDNTCMNLFSKGMSSAFSISYCLHMPTEVRKYVPLHFKKPLLVNGIVLTRAFIIVCFFSFSGNKNKYLSLNLVVVCTETYGNRSFRFLYKRNRIEQRNGKFHALVFPTPFPRSTNFPILSNNDERQKCLVTCCALLVILLDRKMLKAGDLARREDRRVKGVKIGKTR